jgi:hypothetical protein
MGQRWLRVPANGCWIRPLIDYLKLDTEASEIGGQHQAGGTSTNDADLAF